MSFTFVARPRGAATGSDGPAPHPSWGPLAPLVADSEVTDVFVNGRDGVFVDRGAGAVRWDGWRGAEPAVRDLAVTLIARGGRHLDEASPCVDVRLDGNARVHAVLPPISATGTTISVRLPRRVDVDLDGLQRRGMVDAAMRARLEALIRARENLLVTGAGGAGNTTWHK